MQEIDVVDVVTFGEAMAMFIADEIGDLHQVAKFTRELAGAETNVSVGLARLGYRVRWISKVGADSFGQYILEALHAEGVDTNFVQIDSEHPTGFQLKSKVLSGDPQVEYFRKGTAASTLEKNDFAAASLTDALHLHMTGIPPALSKSMREFASKAMHTMKSAGRTVSFDPNLRPKLWNSQNGMVQVINEFAMQADWVMPGISEGEILTGYKRPQDIAAFYLDKGVKFVVVKLGPQGAYFRTETEDGMIPGYQVQVVDTVGAGDGFAVGVISGILDDLPFGQAVKRGNAIGALAVTAAGDQNGLPTRNQLEDFMNVNKGEILYGNKAFSA